MFNNYRFIYICTGACEWQTTTVYFIVSYSSLTDPPTLPDLLSSLQGVVNWDIFGASLLPKQHSARIEIIRKSHPGDVDGCKMALYNYFIQVGVVSWKTVVYALEKSNYPHIATKIKEDFY